GLTPAHPFVTFSHPALCHGVRFNFTRNRLAPVDAHSGLLGSQEHTECAASIGGAALSHIAGRKRSATPFITAIIPAHNEADGIEETIHGLFSQTVMPDRILVVSDNSTDETGALVRGMGVAVMETVDNQSKKAGALNQALRDL